MKKLIYLLLPVAICACEPDRPPKDNYTIQEPAISEESPAAEAKTDEALIKEAITTAVDLGKNLLKQHKINDSVREANREQMYAYRIGFPMKDDDQVFELYSELDLTDNVYALKQSRKEYYLFYYNGNSRQQLEDSLEDFKKLLPENLRSNVAIVNMMQLCTNSRQKLMKAENLKQGKENAEIPCLVCDK